MSYRAVEAHISSDSAKERSNTTIYKKQLENLENGSLISSLLYDEGAAAVAAAGKRLVALGTLKKKSPFSRQKDHPANIRS